LVTVVIAMFFMKVPVFGHFIKPATLTERILFVAGGLFLLSSTWMTDVIGFSMVAGGVAAALFLPHIPVIGACPPEVKRVDLSHVKWNVGIDMMNVQTK
jgi:hypothetical protein